MSKIIASILNSLFVIAFIYGIEAQTLQLDNTFGSSGKLTVDFGSSGLRSSHAFRILVQPTGRIVVHGNHAVGGSVGIPGIVASGLTQGGVLDPGYGSGGRTLEMNVSPRAVEALPNGQALRLVYILPSGSGLHRLNLDGSVDSSFSANLNIGSDAFPVAMGTRADGKILVLMQRSIDGASWLLRLNANGSRDASFGSNGVSELNLRTRAAIAGLRVLSDNRILLGGYQSTSGAPQGGNVAWAALLDENGYYDRRFGLQGVMRLPFAHGIRISKVLLQPDDKIVLVGHGRPQGNERLMLIKLTTRGRRDTSFGNSGIVIAPNSIPGGFDVAHSAALMSDGRVVVVGSYAADQFAVSSFLVARFGITGELEARSVVAFTPDNHSQAYDVAIQPDSKVIVAGFTRNPDASADGNIFAIARFTQQ